jgi:hypothetical protein
MTTTITPAEWLARAATHYRNHGVVPNAADAIAQVLLEDLKGDTSSVPEEAAASDMADWSE